MQDAPNVRHESPLWNFFGVPECCTFPPKVQVGDLRATVLGSMGQLLSGSSSRARGVLQSLERARTA